MINENNGGPAFPQQVMYSENHGFTPASAYTDETGVTVLDFFAAHEPLADFDNGNATIAKKLAEQLVGHGEPPGCLEFPLVALRWEAEWRAKLRYLRAEAMLAEKLRREQEVKP